MRLSGSKLVQRGKLSPFFLGGPCASGEKRSCPLRKSLKRARSFRKRLEQSSVFGFRGLYRNHSCQLFRLEIADDYRRSHVPRVSVRRGPVHGASSPTTTDHRRPPRSTASGHRRPAAAARRTVDEEEPPPCSRSSSNGATVRRLGCLRFIPQISPLSFSTLRGRAIVRRRSLRSTFAQVAKR